MIYADDEVFVDALRYKISKEVLNRLTFRWSETDGDWVLGTRTVKQVITSLLRLERERHAASQIALKKIDKICQSGSPDVIEIHVIATNALED